MKHFSPTPSERCRICNAVINTKWVADADVPANWNIKFSHLFNLGIIWSDGVKRVYLVYPENSKTLKVLGLKSRVEIVELAMFNTVALKDMFEPFKDEFASLKDEFASMETEIDHEDGWVEKLTRMHL